LQKNKTTAAKTKRALQEARIINSFNSHCKAQLHLAQGDWVAIIAEWGLA
jgi:hypothetical protein